MRTRVAAVACLAALPALALAVPASAAWVDSASGSATATATSVRAVAQAPGVVVQGPHATVSWSATTLADGSAVDGYRVVRRIGGDPATTVCSTSSPGALSCEDASPVGGAQYAVVALKRGWSSTESPSSAPLVLDATPPTVAVTRSPAVVGDAWNATDVRLTITGSDAGSGVKEIRYVLGGTTYVVPGGSATVDVTREDLNRVEVWSVDNVGLSSPHATIDVRVDKTAPASAAQLGSTTASGWSNAAGVTVTLSGSDTSPVGGATSGVAGWEYRLGSGPWTAYPAGGLAVTSEGETVVSFRATDRAGNVEAAKSAGVRIDRTGPSLADFDPNRSYTGTGNTKFSNLACAGTSRLCVGVTDALSATDTVSTTFTRSVGGAIQCYTGTGWTPGTSCASLPMTLDGTTATGKPRFAGAVISNPNSNSPGTYTWTVTATDKAGNSTTSAAQTFTVT